MKPIPVTEAFAHAAGQLAGAESAVRQIVAAIKRDPGAVRLGRVDVVRIESIAVGISAYAAILDHMRAHSERRGTNGEPT